jgi:hypothetical protein
MQVHNGHHHPTKYYTSLTFAFNVALICLYCFLFLLNLVTEIGKLSETTKLLMRLTQNTGCPNKNARFKMRAIFVPLGWRH